MMNFFIHTLLWLSLLAACVVNAAEPLVSPTTGMEIMVTDVEIPGTQVEPKPLENTNSPIVMRVVEVFNRADGFSYDFSFYGIIPGKHDLRDYLRREDGSSMEGAPEIPVEVVPLRPRGELVRPAMEVEDPPRIGGYKLVLIAVGAFWFLVLALLIFGFRKRPDADLEKQVKPLTLADQLRPLVKKAQAGELSQSEQAELERKLLGIWRKRLKLEEGDPAAAIIQLRKDEEAGALLRELEKWLHKPGSADEVDVAALLKPYEKLPPE